MVAGVTTVADTERDSSCCDGGGKGDGEDGVNGELCQDGLKTGWPGSGGA